MSRLDVYIAGWIQPRRSRIITRLERMLRPIRRGGFSFGNLRPFSPKHHILATATNDLIRHHARSVPESVRYGYYYEWFSGLKDRSDGNPARSPIGQRVVDAAIDAVSKGFSAGNEILPGHLGDYLRDWLVEAAGLVKLRLHHLLSNPSRLPRQLWTGTGGHISSRIFRHAVLQTGGSVTGHDHATGIGYLDYNGKMLMDYESCDTYVTMNESQATGLKKSIDPDLLIPPEAPKIVAVPATNNTDQSASPEMPGTTGSPTQPQEIRSIMYASSFYTGDWVHYAIQIPDIVALDWEARLFSNLSKWGYTPLHKPHPGSVFLPASGLTEKFGGKLLTAPFEQVMHEADAFLIVNPQSTIMLSLLASRKPVVFIDLGLFTWFPKAYTKLARRCSVVKGWFDETNRAQVDWDELRQAIEESRFLRDTSFHDSYFRLAV